MLPKIIIFFFYILTSNKIRWSWLHGHDFSGHIFGGYTLERQTCVRLRYDEYVFCGYSSGGHVVDN